MYYAVLNFVNLSQATYSSTYCHSSRIAKFLTEHVCMCLNLQLCILSMLCCNYDCLFFIIVLPPRQASGSFSNGSNVGPPALPPRPIPPKRRQTESSPSPRRGSSLDHQSQAPPVPVRRTVPAGASSGGGGVRQVSSNSMSALTSVPPRSHTVSAGSGGFSNQNVYVGMTAQTPGRPSTVNNQSLYVGMTAQTPGRPSAEDMASYRQNSSAENAALEDQEWYWGSISK